MAWKPREDEELRMKFVRVMTGLAPMVDSPEVVVDALLQVLDEHKKEGEADDATLVDPKGSEEAVDSLRHPVPPA